MKVDLVKASELPAEPIAEGEIPARVYTPECSSLGDPRPILLWFHGGGMVIGDNYVQSDRPARRIANRTHCIVLAVEYGLAPEHPFPAGVQDCCASLRWAAEHGGASQESARVIRLCGSELSGEASLVHLPGRRARLARRDQLVGIDEHPPWTVCD